MPQVSGINAVVGVYDETTWGTAPTVGVGEGRRMCISALDIQPNQELIRSDVICSAGRGMARPARGNLAPGGSLRTEVAPEDVGFWLRHLLGVPSTSGTDPYTHTFTPAALPEGFTLEKDWTAELAGKVEHFAGCRLDTASFSFPQSGFVGLDLSILGKTHSVDAAVIDSSLDTYGHTGFSAAETSVKLDGAAVCTVRSASLVIANGLAGDLYTLCSQGQRYSLAEGRCMVSGTLELVFDSFDLLEDAIAGTAVSIELILSRGDGLGSAGNESLSFLVTDADITRASPPIQGEGGVIISVAYEAFAAGADKGIEVTLKNAVAAADL